MFCAFVPCKIPLKQHICSHEGVNGRRVELPQKIPMLRYHRPRTMAEHTAASKAMTQLYIMMVVMIECIYCFEMLQYLNNVNIVSIFIGLTMIRNINIELHERLPEL